MHLGNETIQLFVFFGSLASDRKALACSVCRPFLQQERHGFFIQNEPEHGPNGVLKISLLSFLCVGVEVDLNVGKPDMAKE